MAMPICCKCKQPIVKMEQHFSPMNETYYFNFYCHGEMETWELSLHTLDDIGGVPKIPSVFGDTTFKPIPLTGPIKRLNAP